MLIKKVLLAGVAMSLFLAVAGHAEKPRKHADQGVAAGGYLSPQLTELLVEEMQLIEKGMMSLVPAIAAGSWQEVAVIGDRIHDSYIMKQKLSPAQLEELHHSLPEAFQEMDQGFHRAAGMLAHAARVRNADVVNFYFYKLVEACVSCHTKFATHRFPGLLVNHENEAHKH